MSGLDIGAHKTRAVVTDLRGNTLAARRVELDPALAAADRIRVVVETAHACWAEAEVEPDEITEVVCGVTGALRAAEGVNDVRTGPFGSGLSPYPLPGFSEPDLSAVLSAELRKPVAVANDVKLASPG
ncbi:ROK family protein [Kribbella qitaiheensis]|uniref:ROK family protein n=1 Tax=Kribbella qitaiheensis TaxID=1544730 RepID=UPI001625518C|nr:ROK family protein [Kribbella qitaiheensis]